MAMSSPAEAGLVASVATSVAMPPALVRVDHDHPHASVPSWSTTFMKLGRVAPSLSSRVK